MGKWLLRGLAFAALMVVVRVLQGALIEQFSSHAPLVSLTLLTIFGLAALMWGFIEGRNDARAHPDPDRRDDLAMTWLLAGLVAGIVSGVVSWLISLAYSALYTAGLISELTTFAAFTSLLVFLPAVVGVSIGRWVTDRHPEPVHRHSHAYDDEYERADTDVFEAVRDDTPTGEIPVAAERETRTSRVTLAERDDDTAAPNEDPDSRR